MTIPSRRPRPITRRQEDEQDHDQATAPLARLAVRNALREAFTDLVDDVRLTEVDGMAHVYVSVRLAASTCPELIRATAREAYRTVRGEPVVAHVSAACPACRRR
ncbi:hypothetical protein [Microbispora bryophytorum]|uniref:Uncharacterized protein n=1 Tax=Microbispora bryophytorum TaxID=1460882 RepID=A0A8H9H5D0_9ACTN|nr:hypothetical protein [Microbispora bryophytorum]MBD3139943.1 hypothetical protein [Microbispora bryophytorum]TQS01602.1 hypothetical protein FLX07_32470 [Microbispora bryophytorum]GGO28739.1 hypothetical protein GCM10011574_63510 [Microbispora bryophytorum]